jgi:putative transposase
MPTKTKKRNGLREIPEELWNLIEPRLPPDKPPGADGRPRVSNRTVLNGILYVLRTGCPWKMVPRTYSSGSTCHLRFQTWVRGGVFQRIWRVCLKHYDDLRGIDWRFQSMDSATVSAPVKGGDQTGKDPTNRGKLGTKRHQLTDAQGLPSAVTLCGANRHDR